MLALPLGMNGMVLITRLLMKNGWQLETSFREQRSLQWHWVSSQVGEHKMGVKALKANLEFFWLGFVGVVAAYFLHNSQMSCLCHLPRCWRWSVKTKLWFPFCLPKQNSHLSDNSRHYWTRAWQPQGKADCVSITLLHPWCGRACLLTARCSTHLAVMGKLKALSIRGKFSHQTFSLDNLDSSLSFTKSGNSHSSHLKSFCAAWTSRPWQGSHVIPWV